MNIKQLSQEKEELEPVFNKICNQKDWRAPICCFVMPDKAEITVRAIEFFTATEPILKTLETGQIMVCSEGYRLGPAGDH